MYSKRLALLLIWDDLEVVTRKRRDSDGGNPRVTAVTVFKKQIYGTNYKKELYSAHQGTFSNVHNEYLSSYQ